MSEKITRRAFIQRGLTALAGLALLPASRWLEGLEGQDLIRVAGDWVTVYDQPSYQGRAVATRRRDELLHVYHTVQTENGRNRRWYRVWGGYVHSARTQRVQTLLQPCLTSIPASGQLVETSTPYTRACQRTRGGEWFPINRLYYGSTHWAVAVDEGPDGSPWYQLKDIYERVYWAPAAHLRPVPAHELTPIAPQVDSKDKYILISIGQQTLTAYQEGQIVFETDISSGMPQKEPPPPGEIPTDTLIGDFHITVKTPTRPMGDKKLSDELLSGALLGVPWVSFFHETGLSLHGCYWHDNFGVRMSHGCINLRNADALWIYRWTIPWAPPEQMQASQWGTRVSVREA